MNQTNADLTLVEAAARLGISEVTARRRIADGTLPVHRRAGRLFVRAADLNRLLRERKGTCRITASAR